jgi:hypothetical protein
VAAVALIRGRHVEHLGQRRHTQRSHAKSKPGTDRDARGESEKRPD